MSGSPGKERRGRESHILWTLCHQDNSGCKFELLWRGPDLQMPLMGMLSTIPLSKKPAEVEGSTWEIAQGVKAHLTPWWPGSEQPWEIAGSGVQHLIRDTHGQKWDKHRRYLSVSRLQVMCHSHQQVSEQEKRIQFIKAIKGEHPQLRHTWPTHYSYFSLFASPEFLILFLKCKKTKKWQQLTCTFCKALLNLAAGSGCPQSTQNLGPESIPTGAFPFIQQQRD